MVEKSVTFTSGSGLHMHSASELCDIVKLFSGEALIIYENKTANVKSILNLLSMTITKNARVTIQVSGDGEEQIADKIANLICNLGD